MNILEAQGVTAEEVAKVAEKLRPADENLGEFVATLPADLQNAWTFIERTAEELKTESKGILDNAVQMVSSPDYPANMLEALTKRLSLAKKLSEQKDVFWAEVHAKLGVGEGDGIAIAKDWAVHYLFPVCGECEERHPVGGMVVEVILV